MSYTAHQQALIEMGQRLPAVGSALEKERNKVQVLREALEELLDYVETGYGDFGSPEGAQAHEALATTEDV